MITTRAVVAASLLAASLPVAAYLPPAPAILKRVAQHRDELRLTSLEARGTVTFGGDAAERVRAAIGLSPAAGDLTVPAVMLVKSPVRCRLDVAPEGTPPSQRPSVSQRGGQVTGHRGLEAIPAARALVEGICTLLSAKGPGESERLGQQLTERGIDLREVALGRLDGHVAWIVGGRQQDANPQAWFDKQSFQPVRIVAPVAGTPHDVRLLDFGAGPGGERFPRTVEVWRNGTRELRFATEAVTPNPRLSDSLF